MLHYFIINPNAGAVNSCQRITEEVKRIFKDKDNYIIYETKSQGDAFRHVKEVCETLEEETVFYACGGDGTVFEVVNGLAGCDKAILAVMPTGSCNDFLKTYPDKDFSKLENLVNGTYVPVDLLKINDFYSINVGNAGFDAKVNDDVCKMVLKHKNVKKAYTRSIIKNLLHKKPYKVKVYSDGELVKDGNILLMAFANGCYYGGGYNCAPNALPDDGLMDIVIFDNVSIFKLAKYIGKYKKGEHVNNLKLQKICKLLKGQKVEIESENDLCFCIDGETVWDKKFTIEVLKHHIRFVLPQ